MNKTSDYVSWSCDYVQGNHIAEPVTAAEFVPLIVARAANRTD